MNENQVNPNSLLDTTDCLEAVGVFRGWKNFLFVIVFLCLLLSQICFWLVTIPSLREYFIESGVQAKSDTPDAMPEPVPREALQDANKPAEDTAPAASEPNEATAETVAEQLQPAAETGKTGRLFGITFAHLSWLIRFVNAVLILTATLYCLTMLFSLKVSLVGRLGGINHICRAFFLSLILLILLLPWQNIFGRIVAGAIYAPEELARWCFAEASGRFDTVLYYLRFSGYWLLVVLLLILSQFRSSRWAGAILRRLEII